MCGLFRAVFLKGLEQLMANKAVLYHRTFEELKAELIKKRWVVHNTRPTAKTQVIEEYLSRYICRIGISNSRLSYDKEGKNVRIQYNDYRNQQQGKAAPKQYRHLTPLVAIEQILQHVLPLYFQKVRHYGLHSGATYNRIKDQIPGKLIKNGKTVRTIIQILRSILGQQPYHCTHCGLSEYSTFILEPKTEYIKAFLLMTQGRSPPDTLIGSVDENCLSTEGKPTVAMPAEDTIGQNYHKTPSYQLIQLK